VFKSGATAPINGTSPDGKWLFIQNPDKADDSCWVPFESGDLSAIAGLVPVVDTTQPLATPTLPAPPTLAIPAGVEFVRINSIEINAQNQYVVNYETFEYTEALPGMHVHFFFNTVSQEQAGSPGKGPWKLYGGPRPFTGYKTSDRPQNASQICALVANPNHSIHLDSGNCVPLPDVTTATARIDTACTKTPVENGELVATFKAGATVLLRGISSDKNWLSIQHPDFLDASSCWVPFNSSVLTGDIGKVPVVNP
jgi:hypothetical protein